MLTDSKPRRMLMALAAAGASLAMLAGCGGSDGDADGGGRTTGPTSPAPSSSVALTQDDLRTVLLTAADIGDDFADRVPPGTDAPLPCAAPGDPTLDQQAPPAVQAGSLLVSDSLQGRLSQQLKVYDNEAAASAAASILVDGFGCATGSLYSDTGSTQISLVGPIDVTAEVDVAEVDGVVLWEFTSVPMGGLVVAAQFGASLMLLTLASPTGSDPALYPDPLQVIQGALRKIVTS